MEFQQYKRAYFILNNEKVHFSEARKKALDKLNGNIEDWEKSIWLFISEWFCSQEAIEIKTSGSTGMPKKIRLKKQWMILSAKKTISFLNLKQNQTALINLPAEYIAGKMMLVRAFVGGLNIIAIPPKIKLSIPLIKIDFAAFIPLQLENLIESRFNFNQIETSIIGGAPISNNLLKKIKSLPNAIFATYGMTETITHIALQKLNGTNTKNFFSVLNGIKINTDERNCLNITSPYTNETLQTNDIVKILSPSTFIWLGRADNVINSGGLKISPEAIEKKLSDFIFVPFFIYGLKNDLLGETINLFIQSEYHENSLNKLSSQIKKVLPKNHQPKQIIFLPKFCYTENLKIQRKKTVELLSSAKVIDI